MSHDDDQDAPPEKPRRSIRRRWIAVILFVAIVLGHLFWIQLEERRFMAAVNEVRSTGQPALPEDLVEPQGDDSNNPVPAWRAVFNAVDAASFEDNPIAMH